MRIFFLILCVMGMKSVFARDDMEALLFAHDQAVRVYVIQEKQISQLDVINGLRRQIVQKNVQTKEWDDNLNDDYNAIALSLLQKETGCFAANYALFPFMEQRYIRTLSFFALHFVDLNVLYEMWPMCKVHPREVLSWMAVLYMRLGKDTCVHGHSLSKQEVIKNLQDMYAVGTDPQSFVHDLFAAHQSRPFARLVMPVTVPLGVGIYATGRIMTHPAGQYFLGGVLSTYAGIKYFGLDPF